MSLFHVEIVAVHRNGCWLTMALTLFVSLFANKLGIAQSEDVITVRNSILKPTQTVSVAAGVAGVIESVLVKEGDQVTVRQNLVQIRCDEAKLNHERAILALETASAKAIRDVDIRLAEKSAEVAEQELGRTDIMFSLWAVPKLSANKDANRVSVKVSQRCVLCNRKNSTWDRLIQYVL